jgi:stage V sporulation protein R
MQQVVQIIRKTSLYFQPQIRTKIMNEGWASYWHEKLFMGDDRIRGHEVDFARVHAGVTSLSRVGLNPYALGLRLFQYIEELGDKGRYSLDFRRLSDTEARRRFDRATGTGRSFIFAVRENFADFTFLNTFVDQDFVDRHRLFVAEKRLNRSRMVWEYVVKSRKASDYLAMLLASLYHPPRIEVAAGQERDGTLRLVHRFENKPLVREYLANTMLGIEYLWGGPVELETSEVAAAGPQTTGPGEEGPPAGEISWRRVVYRMEGRRLTSTTQ